MNSKVETAFLNGFLKVALAGALSTGVQAQQAPIVPQQPNLAIKPAAPVQTAKPQTDNVYARIKRNEGFRANTYNDHLGNPTIGYGSTNPNLVRKGTITEPVAAAELTNKVNSVTGSVSNVLGGATWSRTPQPVRDSLIDLGYQTGSLSKWPKLTQAVKDGNYANAIAELRNSKVNIQTPNRNESRISLIQQWLDQQNNIAAR